MVKGGDIWRRPVLLGGVILAVLAGVVWWQWPGPDPASSDSDSDTEEVLPVPPIPPRIASGEDYERCLAMLGPDPTGAHDFADAWVATGGGDGAEHCLGLADVALGEADTGAARLDKLAQTSKAPASARASVFGQAAQAWMMAGEADRALASDTLALSMTPDDADLLIDRSVAEGTLEQYAAASDDLTRALELDPKRADALVFRAAAWRHLNKLDRAQDDIDRAFALDPEYPDALLERGILRQRRGDRTGARRDWERAVALSPDSATGDLAQQNLALLDAGPERR
jgi:tetratricopeptide (TPR) repeat protein